MDLSNGKRFELVNYFSQYGIGSLQFLIIIINMGGLFNMRGEKSRGFFSFLKSNLPAAL